MHRLVYRHPIHIIIHLMNVYSICDYFFIYCKCTGLAAAANFFNTCLQTNEQTQGEIIIFVLSFEEQIRYYCKLSSILIEKNLARMNPVNIMSWAKSDLLSMFVHWVKNVPPGIWPSTAQASNWSRS